MIREALEMILNSYLDAKTENFINHPLADLIRNTYPKALSLIVPDEDRYICEGGAGQSKWADCPWLVTMDSLVTTSVEKGYYIAYLFKCDMSGVYLTLAQSITILRENYHSIAKDILVSQAERYRQYINQPTGSMLSVVELCSPSPSSTPSYYEASSIIARYYPASALPDEAQLLVDFKYMLSLYQMLFGVINRLETDEQKPENKHKSAAP